jgi:hypothetical protein
MKVSATRKDGLLENTAVTWLNSKSTGRRERRRTVGKSDTPATIGPSVRPRSGAAAILRLDEAIRWRLRTWMRYSSEEFEESYSHLYRSCRVE